MRPANPFIAPKVAERYAEGRPYHHRRTMQRLLALGRGISDGLALDVACGTGLSTRALAELGLPAVGIDLSPAMVEVANQRERLPFVVAAAEAIPVKDGSVATMTVGSGLHWLDTSRFFAEAARVLAPGGDLLVYEHAGVGLADDERFSAWISAQYLSRYPSPPTPGRWLAPVDAPKGLVKTATESWEDTVEFSQTQLVAYFLTQGNVSKPIDAGDISVEEAHRWLLDETAAFFSKALTRDFSFLVMAEVFAADERAAR